jgi:hypothetical protein
VVSDSLPNVGPLKQETESSATSSPRMSIQSPQIPGVLPSNLDGASDMIRRGFSKLLRPEIYHQLSHLVRTNCCCGRCQDSDSLLGYTICLSYPQSPTFSRHTSSKASQTGTLSGCSYPRSYSPHYINVSNRRPADILPLLHPSRHIESHRSYSTRRTRVQSSRGYEQRHLP